MSGRNSTTSSQLSPSLATLADPPTRLVDSCAMDYFLIEAVNALRASSAVASARAKKVEQEMIDAGLIPTPAVVLPPLTIRESTSGSVSGARDSVGSTGSKSGSMKTDDEDEGVRVRLESIGVHVGANFTERYACCSSTCSVLYYLSFTQSMQGQTIIH